MKRGEYSDKDLFVVDTAFSTWLLVLKSTRSNSLKKKQITRIKEIITKIITEGMEK